MNWNKVPRSECEAAAERGDQYAQAALDLHHRLDRIDDKMDSAISALEQTVEKFKQLRR